MPKPSARIHLTLTQLTTTDGETLAGGYVPSRRKWTAVIWLHGLTSSFESGQILMSQLSRILPAAGYGYFKFNTRGAHLADYSRRGKNRMIGSSFEKFHDSIKDVKAMIRFARQQGYKRIILIGHSTGASKALYYQWKTKDPRVKGLILLGPASDIAGELKKVSKTILFKRLKQALAWAQRNPNRLVPTAWGPWSASRYVSLFTPGGAEDIFPYHRLGGRWTALRSVRVPILIVLGERDEYLDRPAADVMDIFQHQARSTQAITTKIIPHTGHGFDKQQTQLASIIRRWLKRYS